MTGLHRRRLLAAGAAGIGGTAVGWGSRGMLAPPTEGAASGDGSEAVTGGDVVPFFGVHQAGIDTAPQAHLSLLGLDLVDSPEPLDALTRLLRLLSDDAARLTQGSGALADTEPELAVSPARLTVTFGVGPRLLRLLRPAFDPQVVALPEFSQDRLEEAWGQSDVVVQVCSEDPLTLAHARRMLLKDAAPFTTTRWVQDGFRRARGTEAAGTTMRNLMGQVDGTVNLATTDHADLLWNSGTAAGFEGGTSLVVRRIEMDLVDWDRTDRVAREFSVGRRLSDGSPLSSPAGSASEHDESDFEATDANGFLSIDPASHIARARAMTHTEQFLRRAYNYSMPNGQAGLVFCAYAADLATQFVPVQQRLDELDLLNEWVTTIGSAVYAIPPGCAEGDFVGRALLGLEPPGAVAAGVAAHTGAGGEL